MEAFLFEALAHIDDSVEKLTEDIKNGTLVTTYKNYDIYRYSEKTDPGYRNDRGVHEPYRDMFYVEDSRGNVVATGLSSLESSKETVEDLLRGKSYEEKRKTDEKLVDTVAETYRGFEIVYDRIQNSTSNPVTYSYRVETTRKSRDLSSSELERTKFKTIKDAKTAIDDRIDEWNSYADDSVVYHESVRHLIKETLRRLDEDED